MNDAPPVNEGVCVRERECATSQRQRMQHDVCNMHSYERDICEAMYQLKGAVGSLHPHPGTVLHVYVQTGKERKASQS